MDEERFPYEIVSHWRVRGAIDDVFAVLTDGQSLPRWWPQAYASVKEVVPGDRRGVGRVADIVTRGVLPYDIKWRLEITEIDKPTLIRVKATGELTGRGEWRIGQEGDEVALTYTWQVSVGKPWLRRLEFILKPLFTANHKWAMKKGLEGMKRELARRAAA